MRFFQTIIAVLALTLYIVGCRYNKCYYCEVVEQQIEEVKPITSEELAEIATARQKRLEELRNQLQLTPLFEKWHHSLDQDSIRSLSLSEDVLFAETNSRMLYAFDRTTGVPMWMYTVEEPVDFQPEVHGDKVYLVSMGMLHILHKKTGEPVAKKELKFAPSSRLCPTDSYLYAGGWDSFLYALDTKTGDMVWRHRIDGYIEGQPVEAGGVVFVAGTDNRVYAINAQSGQRQTVDDSRTARMGGRKRKWGTDGYYSTRAANVAPVAVIDKPELMYIGSRDYNCYCLNRSDGSLQWKNECQGEINGAPSVLGTSIYITADNTMAQDSTLYRIDGITGEVKAKVNHGVQMFFNSKYDWVLRRDKKLAMVTEAGDTRNIFELGAFDFFVSNVNLDQHRLGYMATKDGFIFAVEEK